MEELPDGTDHQDRQEGLRINDPFRVVVGDAAKIYASLPKRVHDITRFLSVGNYNHSVFCYETTNVQVYRDTGRPLYKVESYVHQVPVMLNRTDERFYSLDKIGRIRSAMEARGVPTSIIGRKGVLLNLYAQKDGVAVLIDLHIPAKLGSTDEFYLSELQREDLVIREDFKKDLAQYNIQVPEDRTIDPWVTLRMIDKDTLDLHKIEMPQLPENSTQFAQQLAAYGEIYQSLLNAVSEVEEVVPISQQTIEFRWSPKKRENV